ncbi:MAG: Flp family type IVb pilin [Planctomycetota bacterium]
MQRFAKFVRDESATTAVEYSIMLGFIMLVLIGAVAIFGVGQGGKWNGIWGQMNAHGM